MSAYETKIHNIFRPHDEARDPQTFAGRSEEVKRLATALHRDGCVPMIYGSRGLGKSSLAWQLDGIARGDTELLSLYGLPHLAVYGDDYFETFYLPCGSDHKDFRTVLGALSLAMQNHAALRGKSRAVRVGHENEIGLLLKGAGASRRTQYVERPDYPEQASQTAEQEFDQTCGDFLEETGRRVLFIIDEFDRVRDPSGAGTFFKTHSSREVRFVVVGIASDVADLISDHESMGRKMLEVRLEPMDEIELAAIIDRAEVRLRSLGYTWSFPDIVKDTIVALSCGYPWFVHLIGQGMLDLAYEEGSDTLGVAHLVKTVEDIASCSASQRYTDLYRKAVGRSRDRESILRYVALNGLVEQQVRDINRTARARYSVSNPSHSTRELTTVKHGRVFRPAGRGWIAFRDHMFQVFVTLHPTVHALHGDLATRGANFRGSRGES